MNFNLPWCPKDNRYVYVSKQCYKYDYSAITKTTVHVSDFSTVPSALIHPLTIL